MSIDIREYQGPIMVKFYDGEKWEGGWRWDSTRELLVLDFDCRPNGVSWRKPHLGMRHPTHKWMFWVLQGNAPCTITTPDGTPLVVKE